MTNQQDWQYYLSGHGSASSTFTDVQNKLNTLQSSAKSQSVKIASCDQHDGDAHAVMFWLNNAEAAPAFPASNVWTNKVYVDKDFTTLCKDVVNDLNSLAPEQSWYARVSLNDHEKGTPTIVVWYLAE